MCLSVIMLLIKFTWINDLVSHLQPCYGHLKCPEELGGLTQAIHMGVLPRPQNAGLLLLQVVNSLEKGTKAEVCCWLSLLPEVWLWNPSISRQGLLGWQGELVEVTRLVRRLSGQPACAQEQRPSSDPSTYIRAGRSSASAHLEPWQIPRMCRPASLLSSELWERPVSKN